MSSPSAGAEVVPNPKLPLWGTIGLSYSTYFRHFTDVLRISWVWLVAVAALIGVASWQQWSWMATMLANAKRGMPPQTLTQVPEPIETIVLGNLANLAVLLAGVSIAVAWHRLMILGENPGLSGSNVATRNLWRYIGIGLAICLIVMLPVAAIVVPIFYFVFHSVAVGSPHPAPAGLAVLVPIVFLLYFVAAAVMLRLSLLLPARAIGNLSLTFKQTWNRTRGNTWRIFWGIFACTIPATILAQIVLLTLVGFPTPTMFGGEAFVERMTVTGTVFMVYYLLIVPIGIGFLSHSYRHFFQADLEPTPGLD